MTATANSVFAKVFSAGDVKYAAIHEYGGQTAPHIIEPKKANVLAFAGAGGMVFAKRVNHPGSKMPQRSFMRSALKDMSTEISLGMKKAVVDAATAAVNKGADPGAVKKKLREKYGIEVTFTTKK